VFVCAREYTPWLFPNGFRNLKLGRIAYTHNTPMVDFVPIVVSIQNHKPSQLIPLHRRNVGIVYTYIIYLHTSCGLYIRILFYYIFDVEFFKSSNNHIVCRNRYNILVLYIIILCIVLWYYEV